MEVKRSSRGNSSNISRIGYYYFKEKRKVFKDYRNISKSIMVLIIV